MDVFFNFYKKELILPILMSDPEQTVTRLNLIKNDILVDLTLIDIPKFVIFENDYQTKITEVESSLNPAGLNDYKPKFDKLLKNNKPTGALFPGWAKFDEVIQIKGGNESINKMIKLAFDNFILVLIIIIIMYIMYHLLVINKNNRLYKLIYGNKKKQCYIQNKDYQMVAKYNRELYDY